MSLSAPIRKKLYTVAILGRPNVGKSTLFNRLLGRRSSITDATPGVTRDVLEAEAKIRDLRYRLLDTGGYTVRPGDIESKVSRASAATAESCDLALLVVEVGGLTREDYEFSERLRRFQAKLVLVVNKVDSPKQELAVGDFHALGFRRIVPVSAAHGLGVRQLESLIYEEAAKAGEKRAEEEPGEKAGEVRLAILGKPNTGKSTLANLLLREERSLVSEIPGTTRDPVSGRFLYRDRSFQVIDTAGIRRKSRVTEAVEYYSVNRAIKSIDEADVVVILLDAREGVSDQDKKIAALAVRRGRGLVLALNKSDLLARLTEELAEIKEKVRFFFPTLDYVPVVALSACTGYGLKTLLDTVLAVRGQLGRRVATNRLNRAVRGWVAEYPLPVRGRNVKIRYSVQTGADPVRFLLFVNNRNAFPSRYLQYLKNRIRRDLGFDKIPVEIELRES